MIRLQEATTHNEEVTMKAKEQFHFYYGADQLMLFHKTFVSQEGQIMESKLRSTSSSACGRTPQEEVRCLPQGRVLERLDHTANGPSHVSEFNVACTSALNWGGDHDGTNARSLSSLELASLFSQ